MHFFARFVQLGFVAVLAGCGASASSSNDDGGVGSSDAGRLDAGPSCTGLSCFQITCADGGTTTFSGTIFAPNGSLPLMNVDVFVPTAEVPAMGHGVDGGCAVCGPLPGSPLISTKTDSAGHFTLRNVPVAAGVPVVIQIGKWRKQLRLRAPLNACAENTMAVSDARLPTAPTDLGASGSSVELPRIALSTGAADALECLLRKIGIADSAFAATASPGAVQLFADLTTNGKGATTLADGGVFADSTSLWGSYDALSAYDAVLLSCEGGPFNESKSQTARDAMKRYAESGGRVYLGHWHNSWVSASWPSQATFSSTDRSLGNSVQLAVAPTNPVGNALSDWLITVGASSVSGLVPVSDNAGKSSCSASNATPYFTYDGTHSGGVTGVPAFVFTTGTCGRVLFSDVHVSGGSSSAATTPFPLGCSASMEMTPQEKALAFMLFDSSRCANQ